MTTMPPISGKNGALYGQVSQTNVGYFGTNSVLVLAADTTITLSNLVDLGSRTTFIDNTFFLTITDGVNTERIAVSSYVPATGVVTLAVGTVHGYAIGSTVTVGQPVVLNTTATIYNGVPYAAYQLGQMANVQIVQYPVPVFLIKAADGLAYRTYNLFPISGKVAFYPTLAAGDTVDVVYQYANLVQIGGFKDWKVSFTRDTVDTTRFQLGYKTFVPTFAGWTGSADQFELNRYWYDQLVQHDFLYIRFYPSVAFPQNYHYGEAMVTGLDTGASITEAVMEALKFQGNGELVTVGL